MREWTVFDTFQVFILICTFAIAIVFLTDVFGPKTSSCERATVVDKVVMNGNSKHVIYADVDGHIVEDAGDTDLYYAVEIGDQIKYCTYTNQYIKLLFHTGLEGIEQ